MVLRLNFLHCALSHLHSIHNNLFYKENIFALNFIFVIFYMLFFYQHRYPKYCTTQCSLPVEEWVLVTMIHVFTFHNTLQ